MVPTSYPLLAFFRLRISENSMGIFVLFARKEADQTLPVFATVPNVPPVPDTRCNRLRYNLKYVALFCVELYLMRLAVTMFILGVGTSPGGRAWASKSNTMNAGAGGGRPLTSPAPGSVGRRSTISYDQAKTSSSSTERTNDTPRYSDNQLFNSFFFFSANTDEPSFDSIETAMKLAQ